MSWRRVRYQLGQAHYYYKEQPAQYEESGLQAKTVNKVAGQGRNIDWRQTKTADHDAGNKTALLRAEPLNCGRSWCGVAHAHADAKNQPEEYGATSLASRPSTVIEPKSRGFSTPTGDLDVLQADICCLKEAVAVNGTP